MATSEDGADIFEITDFTTASDFERFVARLEEVVHEWKLTSTPPFLFNDKEFDVSSAQWRSVSEEISFINFPFVVTHHYVTHKPKEIGDGDADAAEEVVDSRTGVPKSIKDKWPTALKDVYHDTQPFPSKSHCLCRWFGLTSFVVVAPSSYALSDEKRIKTIINAVSVALHNSSCEVPMFVQALESQRQFYLGEFLAPGLSTSFEMVHLNQVSDRYKNLTGLLEIFKGKVNIPVEPEPKALVSIRATYILQDWETYVFDWPQSPPDMNDSVESSSIGWTGVSTLPFGTCQNPIDNLHLYSMWSNMSEEVITDNQVHSDVEPMNAPIWTVQVTMAKDMTGLLSESMRKFSELGSSSATFEQVIGSREQKSEESVVELTNALERLTEPQTQYNLPSMSKVSKAVEDSRLRLSGRAQRQSPIPVHVLNKMLLHIFPDAKEEEAKSEDLPSVDTEWVKEAFKCYKTAPVDSLPYRLAVCCSIVNYSFGGLKAVAHLWHEIVLELRYRLDNSLVVPGLEGGLPNLSQGLLYQKLQMLNCCIERKVAREAGESILSESSASPAEPDPLSEAADVLTDDEDEFFDCNTDPNSSTSVEEEGGSNDQPQGRMRKLDNLRLLHGNDDLYIPVTQDPAPMTEDTLAEHAEVLTRLGTSEQGATLRAKMQSASLISDMESFKAANIGSVLEDFVRWYSPRDYVVETVLDPDTGDTVEKGCLSDRMLVADNMWQEAWQNAKPVPAKRQKRLFNDTKEAEKVLHYLSNMRPAAVVLHLLPLALQSAILLIKAQGDKLMPTIAPLVSTLTSQLEDCTRLTMQSAKLYADVIHYIQTAELVISRARSLQLKFACDSANKGNKHVDDFVSELMNQQEVKVIGAARGPVGKTLIEMFRESQNKRKWNVQPPLDSSQQSSATNLSPFPRPVAKEYLLRLATPRPAPYAQTLPQRMHCVLNDSEFRLCGAFSADNIFK